MRKTFLLFGFLLLITPAYGRNQKFEDEKPTEGLIELNDANFMGTLADLAQSYDWVLVEFYSHWCPACKAFQPDYKKLAIHINNIVQEEYRSWTGDEDNRPARLAIARIDCPENKKLCDDFEISKYPTMFLDKPVRFSSKTLDDLIQIDPKPRSKNGVISELEKKLGRNLAEPSIQGGKALSIESGSEEEKEHKVTPTTVNNEEPVILQIDSDIIGATIESFEYLKSKPLLRGKNARNALVNWLYLLESSHINPDCRKGAQSALETLDSSWPASANEIQDLESFKTVRICGKNDHNEWVNCLGSSKDSRGYTCGLWMLFHSLSVRMPESSKRAGQEWLAIIKEFIRFFFQCKDCAEHFLELANGADAKSIISKRDGILWLWRTHNKVNKRLAEELDKMNKGDPRFPHIQWPTKNLCNDCANESSWDEDKVYSFLFDHYHGESMGQSMFLEAKDSISIQSSRQESSWRQVSFILGGLIAAIYYYLSRSRHYTVKKAMRCVYQ
jgi:thiol oxidase